MPAEDGKDRSGQLFLIDKNQAYATTSLHRLFYVRSVLFSDTEPAEDPVSNILSRFPAGQFPDDLHRILDLGKDDIRCNAEFHRLFRLSEQFQ
jgi:hypothetical protein